MTWILNIDNENYLITVSHDHCEYRATVYNVPGFVIAETTEELEKLMREHIRKEKNKNETIYGRREETTDNK